MELHDLTRYQMMLNLPQEELTTKYQKAADRLVLTIKDGMMAEVNAIFNQSYDNEEDKVAYAVVRAKAELELSCAAFGFLDLEKKPDALTMDEYCSASYKNSLEEIRKKAAAFIPPTEKKAKEEAAKKAEEAVKAKAMKAKERLTKSLKL